MDRIAKILIRYFILVVTALPNLYIFYFIFAPLTAFPVYYALSLFYDVTLVGNSVIVGDITIKIIEACVSGSAYYLLLILNLSTPKINIHKRIKMLALAFGSFLIINILRIFLLSLLLISGSSWFDFTHKLFWYLGSVVFVVGIWFLEVKLFRIKEIPFYSDLKFLSRLK